MQEPAFESTEHLNRRTVRFRCINRAINQNIEYQETGDSSLSPSDNSGIIVVPGLFVSWEKTLFLL